MNWYLELKQYGINEVLLNAILWKGCFQDTASWIICQQASTMDCPHSSIDSTVYLKKQNSC